jgi:hypothetical protein
MRGRDEKIALLALIAFAAWERTRQPSSNCERSSDRHTPNSILARRPQCLSWLRQWSLASVQVINAFGPGNVGKCALEVAHTIEDDAAVDIGIREVRIEIDYQIEVGEREI